MDEGLQKLPLDLKAKNLSTSVAKYSISIMENLFVFYFGGINDLFLNVCCFTFFFILLNMLLYLGMYVSLCADHFLITKMTGTVSPQLASSSLAAHVFFG